jgi:lysophospholipase L1-like esterase
MYSFGHSIVEATNAESGVGSTSFASMGWRNGYLPSINANAGDTFVALEGKLDAALAALDVGASDVAVVSLGRNDTTAAMDATRLAAYNGILDKLVAKGFGQIMCLGAMPDAGFLAAADPGQLNDSISDMVDARGAGDNVVYVNRNNYTAITTADGTHPNDAGYLEMAALDVVSFDPLLP